MASVWNPLTLYLFGVLSLPCCEWAFSSCREQGLLSSCGTRAPHCGGCSCCSDRALGLRLFLVRHGLSCPAACGIFLDQGSNLCPLHWQVVLNHWTTREAPLTFSSPAFQPLTPSNRNLFFHLQEGQGSLSPISSSLQLKIETPSSSCCHHSKARRSVFL